MNLKEALQALIDGKKIRRKDWTKEKYIEYAHDRIEDHYGDRYCFTISDDSNFELYEEPKKPIDKLNEAWDKFNRSSGNFHFDAIDILEKIVTYLNEKENERE